MRKQLIDQSAHFAAGFLIIAVASLLDAQIGPFAGLFLGFACGLVREITEEGDLSLATLKAALGSRLDLTFWTLGGLAGGML